MPFFIEGALLLCRSCADPACLGGSAVDIARQVKLFAWRWSTPRRVNLQHGDGQLRGEVRCGTTMVNGAAAMSEFDGALMSIIFLVVVVVLARRLAFYWNLITLPLDHLASALTFET